MSVDNKSNHLERRDFLKGLSTVPIVGLLGLAVQRQKSFEKKQREALLGAKKEVDPNLKELNIALLGAGAQGEVLRNAILKIPGIRFKAVCDIWTEYALKKNVNVLKKYKFDVNGYEDYREMLDKEKDLDAVVIATPDFWHARHAIACMKAGLHVYCEKEMSTNLEDARKMVETARETGKLLQIGHQRRSHPKYIHSYDKIIQESGMLGRIVTSYGQWNRGAAEDLGWPSRLEIPKAQLEKYGFKNMHQYRNWRWFKGLGGGPIVDLGSHQIDIFSWFLGAQPTSVTASGGMDYYPKDKHEWYDTVMAIFEYETEQGSSRAYYQTQTTNGSQGYFEKFMGDQGTLVISESGSLGSVYREATAPAWDKWVNMGYIEAAVLQEQKAEPDVVLDVRETISPDQHIIPVKLYDPYHQPHLENFFNAVRGQGKLNCPGEIGYETAVAVLKVNQAIEAKRRLTFDPKEFVI
ncbi:Gfo/Idh/MocA family oxidoreductase [candidate division KSB1 bacterium]|nr:Gfo/Idh/MocA family oxidoreductase [candidate division KSB1 bacterium]